MKILVVGGGGREHALVWKLAQSRQVTEIFAAPGNPGMEDLATTLPVSAEDVRGLLQLAKERAVDLTVVGPEAPLVSGIVDGFQAEGLSIFGPTAAAARLEGSKTFAKEFMQEFSIPTGRAESFVTFERAVDYVRAAGVPIVIKADGLAAGKGVTVAREMGEAIDALENCFLGRTFGEAGNSVLVEEFLEGREASVLAVCDGKDFFSMVPAQDHKPVFDGDRGPNTGGMGAYAPAPLVTPEIAREVDERILRPVVEGMRTRGTPYKGILYAGLMIGREGPKVVEFNCRMGDPETQAVLPLLEDDWFEILLAAVNGEIGGPPKWSPRPAVCVVMASAGYPETYKRGFPISGLETAAADPDVVVFHAGTKRAPDRSLLTAGGRVLGVTGRGDDLPGAIRKAYAAVESIRFEGAHYRTDIGGKSLEA